MPAGRHDLDRVAVAEVQLQLVPDLLGAVADAGDLEALPVAVVTPSTMLSTSVRVSPWSCLCCLRSDGRVTRRRPSWDSMAGGSERVRVPFGPVTVMIGPSSVTSTPGGNGIG